MSNVSQLSSARRSRQSRLGRKKDGEQKNSGSKWDETSQQTMPDEPVKSFSLANEETQIKKKVLPSISETV